MSTRRPIAVLGVPRSGTRYVHTLLRAVGLDVGHECMGPDGTVSGLFAFPHTWTPGAHRGRSEELPQNYTFRVRYALVRDPLRTVPSFARVFPLGDLARYYAELGVPLHGDDFVFAMRCWVFTYRHLQEEGIPVLRVEDAREWWSDLLMDLGMDPVPFPEPGQQNWQSGAGPTSWEELYQRDPLWAPRAYALAEELGYAS